MTCKPCWKRYLNWDILPLAIWNMSRNPIETRRMYCEFSCTIGLFILQSSEKRQGNEKTCVMWYLSTIALLRLLKPQVHAELKGTFREAKKCEFLWIGTITTHVEIPDDDFGCCGTFVCNTDTWVYEKANTMRQQAYFRACHHSPTKSANSRVFDMIITSQPPPRFFDTHLLFPGGHHSWGRCWIGSRYNCWFHLQPSG